MKIEKVKSPDFDLSNLEKYIFNTIIAVVLLFIFSANFYKEVPALRELSRATMFFSYIALAFLILARILSYQNKSSLIYDDSNIWAFYRGNSKISFDLSEISSIKKSYFGLYSSLAIKIKDTKQIICKIRIPAETPKLSDFITNLSEHLSKEQVSDFLKFHQKALAVNFETEKTSRFLKVFCFFIPLIAFFIANNVWESFSPVISILWVILSLVLSLIWTTIYLILLKITAGNFSVFSKIPGAWAISGVVLYMAIGIVYRNFYLWMVHSYIR